VADSGSDRLQLLAEANPDGLIGADASGIVIVLNHVGARMLEVEVDDALGRPLDEVLNLQDERGRRWVAYNRPYESLNIRTGVPEQSWLLPTGREVLTTARLHRTQPKGELIGIGIGMRSGRGRERLDRERSDLVATVAHELRSPLTGVKGFVQVLLNRGDRLTDDQKRLMLTTVAADADRLAQLITDLLDVARIDTGRLQLAIRPVDPAPLVRRVVESIEAGRSREIALALDAELPWILADPDKFVQVATNLIENAVVHGGSRIQVVVTCHPGEDELLLRVQDDGEGIPVEMRRRAFTKFWKGGASTGTGLGLYVVSGLVRAHGGEIELGDAPGGGARASVWWPATARPRSA
jgi:signal transduction histidine kinase